MHPPRDNLPPPWQPLHGPFMGTALVGVLSRSPWQKMTRYFFTIGLGMASPYILIRARFPTDPVSPKPGEWMNTFKQLMGFVLIGTVVYLLTLLKPHFCRANVAVLFELLESVGGLVGSRLYGSK